MAILDKTFKTRDMIVIILQNLLDFMALFTSRPFMQKNCKILKSNQ